MTEESSFHEAVAKPLDPAGAPTAATTDCHPPSAPGLVIAGCYTLQEKLGEGGMGEVWGARQTEPVKRKVALKLIKAGMDSKAVLARFEQERQALALMDHPSIARVFDGGLTPTGQPFFVMELVNGLPLTKFCDEARLTPRERLELFVPICQAVQHAHHKGIVHRDLKPANILVTFLDGKPVPKVIDFGVAKATVARLTADSLATQFGAVIGTLEYMAPEQAGHAGADIDTRADIYSLGVILYELLTGLRPFDARGLKQAALMEMLLLLHEEEPARPSTRLATAEALPTLAAQRQMESGRLIALLRGELDWVVMKCLEKQRDRRYETATSLARDVQRYLADEPVEARPPSTGYRLSKFLRRHRGPVLAAGLVLLALLGGITGTTWGLFEAKRQEQNARNEAAEKEKARAAEAEQRTNAEQANAQAQKRLKQVEKANELLGSIFARLDPKEIARADRPLQALLVEQLDQAVAQLEGEAVGDSLVVATLQNNFGLSLLGLGEPGKAIVLLEKAQATLQAELGSTHPDTLLSRNNLAKAYYEGDKPDLALALMEETLRLQKAQHGLDHPRTLLFRNNLAQAYRAAGKSSLALPLLEQNLQHVKDQLGPEHPHTLHSMNNLAGAYREAGKRDLALPLYQQTLQLRKTHLGPRHPDTLQTMNNLAQAYHTAGMQDRAVPLFEQTLQLRQTHLGPEHPDTLTTMNDLAQAYRAAGKRKESLALQEEAFRRSKSRLGPDHPGTLAKMGNLATAYDLAGQPELALPLHLETLQRLKARLGPDHPYTITAMNNLARAYAAAKQWDRSIPLLEETLQRQEAKFGRDHPNTLAVRASLGIDCKEAGRLSEAVPLLEDAYKGARNNPALRDVWKHLLDAYVRAGERTKLAQLIQDQLAEARRTLAGDSPQLGTLLAQLGQALLEQDRGAEAEPLLRECLAIREKNRPNFWAAFNARSLLGGALVSQKKYAEAEPLLLAGYQGMKQRQAQIPAGNQDRLPRAVEFLVRLYEATNRTEEAAKWQKELEAIRGAGKKAENQP